MLMLFWWMFFPLLFFHFFSVFFHFPSSFFLSIFPLFFLVPNFLSLEYFLDTLRILIPRYLCYFLLISYSICFLCWLESSPFFFFFFPLSLSSSFSLKRICVHEKKKVTITDKGYTIIMHYQHGTTSSSFSSFFFSISFPLLSIFSLLTSYSFIFSLFLQAKKMTMMIGSGCVRDEKSWREKEFRERERERMFLRRDMFFEREREKKERMKQGEREREKRRMMVFCAVFSPSIFLLPCLSRSLNMMRK